MDFDIPPGLQSYLGELDDFIESDIKPLENQDDNIRFFDHRREDARTDWERNGLPNEEWEELLVKAKRLADAAGHYRYPFPKEYGGKEGTNLDMAIIREHLAVKGFEPLFTGHEPVRKRRLLLHKNEILKINQKLAEKGLTAVPLKIYFNKRGWVKVAIGLAKGKKLFDKRETKKRRDIERDINREMKRNR